MKLSHAWNKKKFETQNSADLTELSVDLTKLSADFLKNSVIF
jgi:hypothetical protein